MLSTVSNIIIIVLGCHINDIQNSRIETAIEFSKNFESQTWFLTGGVKHAISNSKSEAEQMQTAIFGVNSSIVIDTMAKNTAENFLNFKKWYQHADFKNKNADFEELPQVVITTSSFHKDRAEMIFKGIFHDLKIEPYWNLSELDCRSCWSDEKIHMRNVESDVEKALSQNIK